MKIAIVARYLPATRDAVGEYASQLALTLAQGGIETVLVTSVGAVQLPEHHYLSTQATVKSWKWRGILRLVAALRKQDVDVVNLQYVPHLYGRGGFNLAVAALPFLLQIVAKKPVITTYHELGHWRCSIKGGWLLQIVSLIQAMLIMTGSAKVIVPVVRQEEQLRRYFPRLSRKVCRIPVGTNIPVVAPALVSSLEGNRKEVLTLGTFGTGQPWWQYEMAMNILRGLICRGFRARLLCVGDIEGSNPEYYRQLRRLETQLQLLGLVEWTGYRPAQEISRYLRTVDIFLALQRTGVTGRSTALIAALAHGLPIVATHGPDVDDWLLQSGAMAVTDPTDCDQAIDLVANLAMNRDARCHLGQRAQEVYHQHLSWEVIGEQFLRVVRSIHNAPDVLESSHAGTSC